MPENVSANPEERFTFVDKRRTADIVNDEPLIDNSIEESGLDLEPEDDIEESAGEETSTAHSIYEVAAYCTGMLINEGFTRLGLIADPQSGKAVMDLPSARVAIDCVAALVQILDEPSSTLSESVRREVKRTLNDLRLNYIQRKSA